MLSHLGWQHPAEEGEEEGVVAEGDHGLDDPEDGLAAGSNKFITIPSSHHPSLHCNSQPAMRMHRVPICFWFRKV